MRCARAASHSGDDRVMIAQYCSLPMAGCCCEPEGYRYNVRPAARPDKWGAGGASQQAAAGGGCRRWVRAGDRRVWSAMKFHWSDVRVWGGRRASTQRRAHRNSRGTRAGPNRRRRGADKTLELSRSTICRRNETRGPQLAGRGSMRHAGAQHSTPPHEVACSSQAAGRRRGHGQAADQRFWPVSDALQHSLQWRQHSHGSCTNRPAASLPAALLQPRLPLAGPQVGAETLQPLRIHLGEGRWQVCRSSDKARWHVWATFAGAGKLGSRCRGGDGRSSCSISPPNSTTSRRMPPESTSSTASSWPSGVSTGTTTSDCK